MCKYKKIHIKISASKFPNPPQNSSILRLLAPLFIKFITN